MSGQSTGIASKDMGKYGIQILKKISQRAKQTQELTSNLIHGITETIEDERKMYNDIIQELPSLKRNKNTHMNNANVSINTTKRCYNR